MNQIYPKRLVNFTSIAILVLSGFALINLVSILLESQSNMTTTDKSITIAIIGFLVLVILGSIGMVFKKRWGWTLSISFMLYTLIGNLVNTYEFGIQPPWFVSLPITLIALLITIFLLTTPVRKYFNLKNSQLVGVFVISISVYLTANANVINDENEVNLHYINLVEEKYYLGDTLFSGKVYLKHKNGNLKIQGQVVEGMENGTWKMYDEEENLTLIVNYNHGVLNGLEESYFSTGELREKKNYFNGLEKGEFKIWRVPNELEISGNYEDGMKQGIWKEYLLEDSMIKVEAYNMDTLVSLNYEKRKSSR